jgi:hypothetical protein
MCAEHYDLDRIREVKITDVCDKMGIILDKNRRACCPFHEEKTPSFRVNEKNFFKCFGCGAGGDVIKFVQDYQCISFQEAIKWLADMSQILPSAMPGLSPHKQSPPATITARPISQHERDEQLGGCEALSGVLGGEFTDRRAFLKYARSRNWSREILTDLCDEYSLGLKKDGMLFNYGYGTKWRMDMDDSRSCRWMTGKAKDCIWRESQLTPAIENVYIFEGETDLICAASALDYMEGFIAAPGASWRPTPLQLNSIGRGRRIHLCFDNDKAGEAATDIVGSAFVQVRSCEVRIFNWEGVSEVGDVGELVQKLGKDSFRKVFASKWISL